LEGQVKLSDKKRMLRIYDDAALPHAKVKHPKIAVPIRPHQAKHTPETDPWLFLLGVFPKTVHEFNKEQVSSGSPKHLIRFRKLIHVNSKRKNSLPQEANFTECG
jgi:hypothetical protein